ncbi:MULTISPECIES: hypothetical protein [Achromobacter]|uniref:Uncharacterized protein n=1 Tax=Achromobacter xylosoxidans (strain A8) TaxID=762376 RepID=E3HYL7_ACHXA|nr:hypothetical protein [Achromobacter xylosoxidans]ADP20171.1 hypothetical protein AXYL_06889 [Achromobacter xylosoxidans A8]
MAINELSSGIGSRTISFLQRAAEAGHEVRVETKGTIVRDAHALGRRLLILGFAASVSAAGTNAAAEEDLRLAPPRVSINGDLVHPDSMLARLVQSEESEDDAGEEVLQNRELIEGLAQCSPGLETVEPSLLLTAYRYSAGWQDVSSSARAGALVQLAQTYADLSTWAANSGRSLELAIAAYCENSQDWQGQVMKWDSAAAGQDDPREFYRGVVLEHRARLYGNVVQAQWEYEANEKLASSLAEQGLQLKVRGDYSGWVSAVGSVARGVAEVTGSSKSQAIVRGATSLASSGAYAARGLERVGDAQGAQRRIDLAGRSISEIARLGRSADRMLDGASRANGSQKKDGPAVRAPRAEERPIGVVSPDARAIGMLSDAAQRMGFQVSLSPLTGEPVPRDHATVIATHSTDTAVARQAAQRNLAEVATLHEFARASGIRLSFDLMYQEYAQLADAVQERDRQVGRQLKPGDRPRGG